MNEKISISIAALIITATSTVFAAENPFNDVPTNHWSFQAVAQLAADGVIEGYGDGSFRGDVHITRYEMAQMVAKAMTKSNISTTDKATLDKLSAEYATELDNFGVRVNALEEKTDNIKISGYGYLRTQNQKTTNKSTGISKSTSASKVYVEPVIKAKVNENWDAVGQFQISKDLKTGADSDNDFVVKGISANGKLFGANVKLGKFEQASQNAVVYHEYTSGAEFGFGNALKTRITLGTVSSAMKVATETSENVFYKAAEFNYKLNKATNVNAAYFDLDGSELKNTRGTKNPHIYTAGFDTRFDNNWSFTGLYLKSSSDISKGKKVEDTGYLANIDYKGAKLNQPGSFGIYLKYIQLPQLTQICTDVAHQYDYKGVELGTMYMLAPNMRGHLRYYKGKNVNDSNKEKSLVRAEVRFFF
jgi:hypothetical protein